MSTNRIRNVGTVTPILILLTGIALTLIATWQLAAVVRARAVERFYRAAHQTRTDISSRLALYTEMLRGGAGLVAAGGMPDRAAFRRYVDRLEISTRYPGVQGIGLSLRIPSAELTGALDRLRRDDPDFALKQPGPRDEFHAIVHIEPLDERNRRAIGYDMFLDSVRRVAMERARDTGEAAASGRVTLVQESGDVKQAGFLIYVPIYQDGATPAAVEERRQRLLGYVYCPFRAEDFFKQVVGMQSFPMVDFEVFDGETVSDDARMCAMRDPTPPHHSPLLTTVVPFDVAGRRWTLSFASRPEFERGTGSLPVMLLGGGGAAFTLLLFGIAWTQHRSRVRAVESARQIELSSVHVREGEIRLRAILDSALDAVISMDHAGIVTEWNPAATRTFGYSRAGAVGRPLAELIIPPYLREHHYKGLARFTQTGEGRAVGRRFETMAIRADGSELPVELSIVRVGDSDPPTFTGFVRDITERRRDERHRELMTRELDHRVKNNLSTVVALVDQTASSSDSFVEFVSSFSGRVRAMAHLHEMLAENRWTGADLGEVIRGIMAPHTADDPSRVTLAGEPLDLPDKVISPLCLALHELTTNATKYGALSVPEGRVEIRWEVSRPADERRLSIFWKELHGPVVTPPKRRGFGTELVERGLAYELRASAAIDHAPEGVKCEIHMAIPQDVVVIRRTPRGRPIRTM